MAGPIEPACAEVQSRRGGARSFPRWRGPSTAAALVFGAAALTSLAGLPVQANEDDYPARKDWSSYWEGSLNISVFVFRDLNRDGLYNLGDQPMSGILVDVTGPGRPSWSASNGAGFANFTMSGTRTDGDIMFEGTYDFAVRVPPQWQVTTRNAVQTTQFRLRPGSPADLIADPAPALVGLAPNLTIFGTLPENLDAAPVLSGPHRAIRRLEVDPAHHFVAPVEEGEWHSQTTPSRAVQVTTTPVQIAQAWWTSLTDKGAAGTKITFDDLQSEGVLKIPSGYAGLGWDNFVMTHRKFYDPEGYRNGVMSGEFLAYNGSGHPAAITSFEPFDFVGGYFGASALDAEGETLLISAWRGDEQVYHEQMTLSALGPTYLAAGFEDITRLEFRTAHYWQFTADDLTVVTGSRP